MRYANLNIDLTNKGITDIFACGDIHGSFEGFMWEIKTRKFDNCFIIVCGDIGLGFNKEKYYEDVFSKLQHDLSQLNTYLLLYRGNHDSPSWFSYGSKFGDDPFDVNYPNIIILDDYSIVKFSDDMTAMFIGGARSVDRSYRILNDWKYWPAENVIPMSDENNQRAIEHGVNYVFTHTTCSYLDISDGKLPQDIIDNYIQLGDTALLDDIKAERELMNGIYNKLSEKLNIKEWICGHFHAHSECEYNNTHFVCLDRYRDDIHHYNHSTLETREYMKRGTRCDWYRVK